MKVKIRPLIIYVTVFALLCFMLWFNHRRAALFFIAAMVLYLAFSMIMQMKNFPLPRISLTPVDTEAAAGESGGFVCSVSSKSFYPFPRIRASYSVRHRDGGRSHMFETDYSVFHGSRDYRLDMRLAYCGVYEIECRELLVYDLFGIFARRAECPKAVRVIVMPEEIAVEADIEALGLSEEREAYSDPLAGDDVSEIKELRDYRQGDRLSQVHWKLSTKSGELVVKEYEKQMGACVALVCEGAGKGLSRLNEYYELLYAFGKKLLLEEIFFELVYYSAAAGDWEKVRIDNAYSLRIAMEDMFFYQDKSMTGGAAPDHAELTGASRLLCLTAEDGGGDGIVLAANKNAVITLRGEM